MLTSVYIYKAALLWCVGAAYENQFRYPCRVYSIEKLIARTRILRANVCIRSRGSFSKKANQTRAQTTKSTLETSSLSCAPPAPEYSSQQLALQVVV